MYWSESESDFLPFFLPQYKLQFYLFLNITSLKPSRAKDIFGKHA